MKLQVKVPAVGESITEATIAEWAKADGEYCQRDEVILVLETDKASVDVVAEQAGVLSIKVAEGETIAIGTLVGEIDTEASGGEAKAAPVAAQPATAQPASGGAQKEIHGDLKNHLSPAVSKIVADKGLNPSELKGTGKDGRLVKSDVMNASKGASSNGTAAAASLPPMPVSSKGPVEAQTRKPMSRLRKTIAKRLVEAQQNAAILTTFNEIDMSALMGLRKTYKDSFKEKHGVNLGFMGFFVKATIEALKAYPDVNAMIDGDDLIYNNSYNVGIAVSTEKGLLVPVIQNAEHLSLAEIELSIRHYALKARDGKISIDDLNGGTFTITNGGVFGSLMSTPILNPPQSGILGMHKIEERPMAINGEVKIRPMMYVALSYDHRVIDGKQSVGFLVRIKECLEDPTRILMDI